MKTKKNASELNNNNNNNENSDPNENACCKSSSKFCLRDIVSIGINGSVVA